MTVKELITQCSYRIDEEIDTSSTDTDILLIINKLKSSMNYAYRKLAKDKLLFLTKETITLENNIFNTGYLINKFYKIKKVTDADDNLLDFWRVSDNDFKVDCSDSQVIVYYYYIPSELKSMGDSTKFPSNVDDMVLVYYASADYLIKSDDRDDRSKAKNELSLYQDIYNNIIIPTEFVKVGDYID